MEQLGPPAQIPTWQGYAGFSVLFFFSTPCPMPFVPVSCAAPVDIGLWPLTHTVCLQLGNFVISVSYRPALSSGRQPPWHIQPWPVGVRHQSAEF